MTQTTNNNNEMVFLMGLPAAGKSTTAETIYADYTFIDCDRIKATHPDYDPKQAYLIHEWSSKMEEQMFLNALAEGTGNFVIDGTGTNAEKMVRRMNQAKAMGFVVTLVYVTCTLATSIRRAAKRTRQVPESMIREKALNIATSFQIVAPYADSVTVINNDADTK